MFSNISFAQTNEKFLTDFLLENELNSENLIAKYDQFDFSEIWMQTENHRIVGIISADYQRIKIKLITIKKSLIDPNEYCVSGKTDVKGIICEFIGTINLDQIKETKELHFGLDNEYKDKGIKSQGVLIADYEFKENQNETHSGIFKGQLYTKWYLNSYSKIQYDDIQSIADGYTNNAFIGTWKDYSTNIEKICNWGDFRVPKSKQDFDIGAGEFSPSEKYYKFGWEIYSKALLLRDENAKKEELKEWWK